MIDRHLLSTIHDRLDRVPAVGLLGARQVGKTTLAKKLSTTWDSVYLDLESPEDLYKLSDPVDYLRGHFDKLTILDEIQCAPDLFPILRGLIDQNIQNAKSTGMYLLLGSASLDLLRQSSQSLAGRITYLELPVLNVLETAQDQKTHKQLWLRGGFPKSYLAPDQISSKLWLDDLISSYLEHEVPKFGFRIPSSRLRRLWTMLAHLQGETVNIAKLAANLEVDSKTISHYIDILVDMLLVRRLEPWFSNVKKRLIKSPRVYIRDSGILHRLLGIADHEALLSHPVLGKSWEGFVIENVHSALPRPAQTFFYRSAAGAEIDLVIHLPSGQTLAVEIKYGSFPKPAKHFARTCGDVNASQKFIVYSGDDEFRIADDVIVISLPKMLERLKSLEKTEY